MTTPLPSNDVIARPAPEAETTSAKRREVIKEVVGSLAEDTISNIASLRRQLDELEKLVLSNAAKVTDNLNNHADICGGVQQEVMRLSSLVADMRSQQEARHRELIGHTEH
jgi:hypothetical protein